MSLIPILPRWHSPFFLFITRVFPALLQPLPGSASFREEETALRAYYMSAGCPLSPSTPLAAAEIPQREACFICEQPVSVAASSSGHPCNGGHSMLRCYLCFRLLPLDAWRCRACGAASCAKHAVEAAGEAVGLLGVSAHLLGAGVCGICGAFVAPYTYVDDLH